MTESRLRELLPDLVEQVNAPSMAGSALAAAARVRRRRRITGAAAAGVLVVATVLTVADGVAPSVTSQSTAVAPTEGAPATGRTDLPSSAPPARSGPAWTGPRIQTAPKADAVDDLPLLDTAYAALSRVPRTAPALSADPASSVIALAQQDGGPVLALGSDGDWRAVDGGRPGAAISPDGRQIALPQPDGLVIVDVTTGRNRRLPAPRSVAEAVQYVRWLAADRIAAGGDTVSLIFTTDGTYSATDYAIHQLALGGPGDPLVEVGDVDVRVHGAGGRTDRLPVDSGDQVGLDDAYGDFRLRGGRVAGSFFLDERPGQGAGSTTGQAVALIDLGTGRVTDLLTLLDGDPQVTRGNGCCATLGWLDDRTVLLLDRNHVLAWRPADRKLSRVAELPLGQGDTFPTVTLAP